MRITIDPGHAGKQNYANGYFESEGNWRFSQVLVDELRRRGAEVLITKRSLNDDPSLTARGNMAAEFRSDVFISIHSDANRSPDRRGVHVIRSLTKPNSYATGIALVQKMAKAMGIPVRANPVWTRESPTRPGFDYYTVLDRASNYTRMGGRNGRDVPKCYLLECGYHTNPDDVARLKDSRLDQKRAEAIADALGLKGGYDLIQGDRGIAVERWQERLMEWNKDALPGYGADGSFGPETVTWTNNFKSAAGHPADGVVDALTWDAMIDALQVKPTEIKVGATVTVNGRGWTTAHKGLPRTRDYKDEPMKIARIHDSGDAPYGMERSGWIVGWFEESQLD